ncbi:MAG: zinc ribbon domain-containing protein [Lachnospiraceae bacterium]
MFCNNCGNSLNDNATVCDKCGVPVQPTGSQVMPGAPVQPTGNQVMPGAPVQPTGSQVMPGAPNTYSNPNDFYSNAYSDPYSNAYSNVYSSGDAEPAPKKKNGAPVGAIVGSSFLVLFGIFSLLTLFVVAGIQNMLSPDSMRQILIADPETEDQYEEMLHDFKMSMRESLAEADVDAAFEEELDEIFDDEELEELCVTMISDAAVYCVSGEGEPFQSERIIDYIKSHEDDIEDLTGEKITEDQYEELEEILDEANKEIIDEYEREVMSVEGIEYIQMFFSSKLLLVISTITVILFLAIFAIFNKRVHYSLDFVGAGLLLAGLLNFVTTALFAMVVKSANEPIVESVISIYFNRLYLFSGIALVVGLAMLVAGIVIGVNKKKANSAELQ